MAFELRTFRLGVTHRPTARSAIGQHGDFPPGARVSRDLERVCIVREGNKLAAISTTCTHPGCIVGIRPYPGSGGDGTVELAGDWELGRPRLMAMRLLPHCHSAERATIIAIATAVASAVAGIGRVFWKIAVTGP
jgi:hypothetical protein